MKYTTMPPVSWWEANAADSLARTIHEREPERKDSGLLNASGEKLWRVEERQPIGFVRFK